MADFPDTPTWCPCRVCVQRMSQGRAPRAVRGRIVGRHHYTRLPLTPEDPVRLERVLARAEARTLSAPAAELLSARPSLVHRGPTQIG